jgi:hypothetical protein
MASSAELLAGARAQLTAGKTAKAKASLVVASCLFPDEAPLLYELWRVCCTSGDGKQAARALEQACKTDALLTAFCVPLVAELRGPGAACGKGWLQGEPGKVERLIRLCLSTLDLTPSADGVAGDTPTGGSAPASPAEAVWEVLLRLAHMTDDHPLVWWAAADLAMGCDALLGAGDFNRQDSKLCTPWSHRLANVCLQHLVHAGVALSCDEVARSKPFVERALIHHLGSAQAAMMDKLADAYLAAASAHVPHLLSLASTRNRPSSPGKGQLPPPIRRTGAEIAAALAVFGWYLLRVYSSNALVGVGANIGFALHPPPSTLHPPPSTLHPPPSTLHPPPLF